MPDPSMYIRISLPRQTLALLDARGNLIRRWAISSARNGPGEQRGSNCTPRGRHIIRARIGAGVPENTVFRGRRPTGEIWTPELATSNPGRDWILTRILWLSGKEPGRNRLGNVDTMRRYIYLHGSPDTAMMGQPGSIGCIRMRNADIIELFERVENYTTVMIDDYAIDAGSWSELSTDAGAIREAVFVVEQGVPGNLEMDSNDAQCHHVLARDSGGRPIGTGRLLPDGHVGRMAVLPAWRGQAVGRALLEGILEEARLRGLPELVLNSQVGACEFYRRFGFVAEGPHFLEAGILHQRMRRTA